MATVFVNTAIKFFFLLTPFFVLSTFLAMSREMGEPERRRLAVHVFFAIVGVCLTLFLAGNSIFGVLGITLDAFRIGTGVLLLLSAISLVQDREVNAAPSSGESIAVVPLAIPVTVGPATTGALLVSSVEIAGVAERVVHVLAIVSAIAAVGTLLYLGTYIERVVGRYGITILRKLTGLVLASLAAQMAMVGVKGFFP